MTVKKSSKVTDQVSVKLTLDEITVMIDAMGFAKDMMELMSDEHTKEYAKRYDTNGYSERARACRVVLHRMMALYEAMNIGEEDVNGPDGPSDSTH